MRSDLFNSQQLYFSDLKPVALILGCFVIGTSHFFVCVTVSAFTRLLYHMMHAVLSNNSVLLPVHVNVEFSFCSTSLCKWCFLGHDTLGISGKAERLEKYLLPLENCYEPTS